MHPEPPAWLSDAVDAVLADLQLPVAIPIEVSYLHGRDHPILPAWYEGEWAVGIREVGDAGTGYFWVLQARGAELMAGFAHYLQDQFFRETRAAWGEARPVCPGHTHPAEPSWDTDTGIAWWSCPATGKDLIEIGRYRELRRS